MSAVTGAATPPLHTRPDSPPAAPQAQRTLRPGTLATTLLVFLWFACTAWARRLMLPDEGRYVGVAWEMLRSGDWLTPTLNGLPYFHKPPLFYWITAASLSVLGHHEWAARVASMLGATLGVMAVFMFLRRWTDERTARTALVAMLAQPLLFLGGQFGNLDMLVAGCISATTVLLAHAALSEERGRPDRRALAGAYAMAAVGVLAKGLIGFVLPALVMTAWLLLQKRWRTLLGLLWWPGALIFLAVAGPWFWAMQQRFPGFLDYFFVVQHFKRFATGGFNNVMPLWFYPAALGLFFLPWLPWLVRIFRPTSLGETLREPVRLLMLSWFAVVVIFFSLPQSKLLGYVLPAVLPLAVLVADRYLRQPSNTGPSTRAWLLSAALAVVTVVGSVAWIATHPAHSMEKFASVLTAQRHDGEPVHMLDIYYFDLPFYARLKQPLDVVDQWDDPNLYRSDSRRKELADAGHFAPQAAADRLLLPAALPARLCKAPTSWVLGPSSALDRYPFLRAATPVHTQDSTTLWRVDSGLPAEFKALGCG